jgi:murein DD-endopeptidase MepM/ murein hydrolase activator NlpD
VARRLRKQRRRAWTVYHDSENVARILSAAGIVALLSIGEGLSRGTPLHVAVAIDEAATRAVHTPSPGCPPQMLPDVDVCVRLPEEDEGAPEAESAQNTHRDAHDQWIAYDEIPRRPDRSADYDAYRYPVPCEHDCVGSGYDLDRPDDMQRHKGHVVGHGAVDLPQVKGTPVVLVALEHQQGDAEVLYVGPLFGTTIITRHDLREAGELREYLLLFGHLDIQAPGMRPGARVKEGDVIGFVGDSGSPNLVHLHLEARRVRTGVDVGKLSPGAMIANENSVVCDPRNVLPLK